jgi:ABC-2 type transport system ATP-binding protein
MPLLEVAGLSKRFGKIWAVRRLSFTVKQGEIVALLGPNGAGKTTTLRCIAGVLLPDEGTIRINGSSVVYEPVLAKQQLGYLPEFPQPLPYLTVWEHLELIARLRNLPPSWRQRAEELVARLNLTEWRQALGNTLPKGVREKTLLACALLPEPPLLLLDEPIVAIDPIGQQVVKGMLKEWREKGHSIVISTHILAFAEELADRIVVMDRGEKIAEGTPEALRERVHVGTDASLEQVFVKLLQSG